MTVGSPVEVRFNEHFYEDIVPPRELRDDERKALEFLLAHTFPGCEALRNQLPFTKVCAACTMCGSVYLAVDKGAVVQSSECFTNPVFADTKDHDGMFLEVLVLVWEGYLDELQIWRGDLGSIMLYPDLSGSKVTVTQRHTETKPEKLWRIISSYVIPGIVILVSVSLFVIAFLFR